MSAQRVLVLGAGGMLGHKVMQVLSPLFPQVWGTLRGRLADQPWRAQLAPERAVEEMDVTAFDKLESTIAELRPDVVVNCTGVIKHRPEAGDAVLSITTNALLPHRLAAVLERTGGRLIHFSTDCVFAGRKGNYVESDPCDAEDLYGRSKALGEVTGANALTLRTSIIGRELRPGNSLLEWFLAQAGGRIRGYRRAWWSGVTTHHLAEVVAVILLAHPQLSGIYHVSSGTISKYELLCRLRAAYNIDVDITPDDEFHCDRSLDGRRFEAATGYRFPGWDALLRQLAADPTPYQEWAVA